MKNRIRIMNEHQDVTSEELERFKNFDAVLKKHQALLKARKFQRRWLLPVIFIAGTVLWYSTTLTEDNEFVNENMSEVEKPTSSQGIEPTDTSTKNKEIIDESVREKEKPMSPQGIEPTEIQEQKQPLAVEKKNDHQKPLKKLNNSETEKNDAVQKKEIVQEKKQGAVEQVYVQAEPVDGYPALYSYFQKELIYPAEALKDSIQGVQKVSFIINIEGKAEKIRFENSLGKPFEDEAQRLIRNMPLWKPATLNGKAVASLMTIRLSFQIIKSKEQ